MGAPRATTTAVKYVAPHGGTIRVLIEWHQDEETLSTRLSDIDLTALGPITGDQMEKYIQESALDLGIDFHWSPKNTTTTTEEK